MQLGIFAKTFPGTDASSVLRQVRTAGFSAAQYNFTCSGLAALPAKIPAELPAAICSAAHDQGVDLVALSGTYNMIHPDHQARITGRQHLLAAVAACEAMEVKLITLCTGTRDPNDQWCAHPDNNSATAWADLCAELAAVLVAIESYDVDLGIEPELANVINSATQAHRLIDELQSPRLKIILDPANLFEVTTLDRQRDIVAHAIDLLADRIVMCHAKDRQDDGSFTVAGTGVLDYPHFIATLRQAGCDVPIVTHGLTAAQASAVAKFLTRMLAEQEKKQA